jgi:uncharacterized protein (TIGR00369 family)
MENSNKEEHYRKLENMYHTANCNVYYSPKMKISEAKAEITIPILPKLFHAAHAAHGSVYFKILDDSAYFAANSLVDDVFLLTANFNIFITRPISTGRMKAIGEVVNTTKNQFISQAVVYNSDNKEIGRGTGLYVRGKSPLNEKIGYK